MIYKLLKEYVGMDETEADSYFNISETDKEWVLSTAEFLERNTYAAMRRLVEDRGGTYTKGSKESPTVFTVPKDTSQKVASSQISSNEKVADSHTESEGTSQEDYSLARSMKSKLQQLVPCLKDADGQTIDGFHRLQINPEAWTVKLDHIKTPADRALARMAVNFCRRHYTSQEMTNDIGLLIGSGYSVQQIAEVTGISERTVYRYMPEHLKDEQKVKAGEAKSLLTPVTTKLKTQETIVETPTFKSVQEQIATEITMCEGCGQQAHRSRLQIVGGKLLCPQCRGEKPRAEAKPEPPKPAYKEKWEHRVAQMHPQKSAFELAVIQGLQAEGIPLETDVEICAVKTIPDAVLRLKDKKIAIYIDNEITHPEGNGRDEFLRDKIEQQDWLVLPVRWKYDSEIERQNAKETIKEFLKW